MAGVLLEPLFCFALAAIKHSQLVVVLGQVAGHGCAHVAKADEGYVHVCWLSCGWLFCWLQLLDVSSYLILGIKKTALQAGRFFCQVLRCHGVITF